VAVRNTPETSSSPKLFDHLAVSVVAGVAYVLAGIGVVFYGLPSLWWSFFESTAITVALLGLVMVVAATFLIVVGVRLLNSYARPGLRAGIFFGLFGILVAAEIASAVGTVLEHNQVGSTVGLAVSAVLDVVLVAGLFVSFRLRGCERWLITVEEQGWFTAASYKRSQGLRVRRGTMLGILILAACGIYTLLAHRTLQSGLQTWVIPIPYTTLSIPLLPHVSITLPLLLAAASLWLAYRVVNYPTFADFLIATEAEMNKVSWTTRKRLVQDTVVVLVTVALLTLFLFVVDQAWAWALSKVGVLRLPPPTETAAQKEPSY
jgi:preprotein translocase SecE subunit